ncbi:MAG: hypothetical protein SFW67_21270 [Myxococcaceae bacterium]|nr:hypothetical protein [Myxococcaceae bacterium]
MRWLVPCLLLVLGGCLPTIDLEPPPRCDVFDGGLSTPSGRAVFVGRETMVVASRRAPTCPPAEGVTAQVRVTDPAQALVPAEVEGPFVRGQFHGVEVRFTPTVPGPWRVDAVFEPALGRALNEVWAVEVFEPTMRRGAIPEEQRCAAEGLTAQGTMVCLSFEGAQVSFWRDGQQLQAVPGLAIDVRGDSVFVVGPGRVERFVDSGGAFLRRVPDVALTFDASLLPLDAVVALDEERLLVASGGRVLTFSVTSAPFAPQAVVTLPQGLCIEAPRLIPGGVAGFQLACTSRPGASRFCRTFDAQPDACFEVRGRLVGADAEGLWVNDGQTIARVRSSNLSRSLQLPAGWTVLGVRRWAGSLHPLVVEPTGRAFLVREGAAGVVLSGLEGTAQLLAAPPGLVLLSASDQRLAFSR